METTVAFIGFGEAGAALAPAVVRAARTTAFDLATRDAATAETKRGQYLKAGVIGCDTAGEALEGVRTVLCLVTADQAVEAARACAPLLASDALWLDMNSVSPQAKTAAARAIEACGARYVDVAVMAPVEPARAAVPLLTSGPHATEAVDRLTRLGFTSVRAVGPDVGAASAIKMIRSVMIKGMEALTVECLLAAFAAGVEEEVIGSLNASAPSGDWRLLADYNLDRLLVHGRRRAAELDHVSATLVDLGVVPDMTRAARARHDRLGSLALGPPDGLAAKIEAIRYRSGAAPA